MTFVAFAGEPLGGGAVDAVAAGRLQQVEQVEAQLEASCRDIPYAENLLEISGIGDKILSGIASEIGDISRFDDVKEIQKLSGMSLVACSSGKHQGKTKISHRGRKRLRYCTGDNSVLRLKCS